MRSSASERRGGPLRVLVPVGSAALGGSELALLRLIDACPREEAQFRLWLLAAPGGPLEAELRARTLPWRRYPRFTARTPWGLARLGAGLERERPAVVYLHASRAIALLCRARRIPCIERINMPRARGAGGWCRFPLLDRVLTGANTLALPVSEALAGELIGRGVAAEKLRVLRDAIDPRPWREARTRRLQARAALGLAPETILAISAGRLVPQKAQADFLEVAAQLAREDARWRFLLVGDGPLRAALAAQVEALGLGSRLRLLPFHSALPELFAASDLYLQTSRWEGLAMVLLEAMAAGLAVVATDVGGTREAITPYPRGALVAPGDTVAMAREAARAVAAGPRFAESALPAFPEGFAPGAVARRFLEIAREAAGAAAGGRP